MRMPRAFLFWLVLCCGIGAQSRFAHAAFENQKAQEQADVVFRNLQFPLTIFNLHGGIYSHFESTDTTVRADPDDLESQLMIEMVGITGQKSSATCSGFSEVTSTQGISEISLQEFEGKAYYQGAYRLLNTLLDRGVSSSTGTRQGILRSANELLNRSEFIDYVVVPEDCTGDARIRYGSLNNPDQATLIEPNGIKSLRSDAFVEFSYARNQLPIVSPGQNITQPNVFRYFNKKAAHFLPTMQKRRMERTKIDDPSVVVLANGSPLYPGEATKETSISVNVEDEYAGPYVLEIYNSDSSTAPWKAAVITGVEADTTSYTYTSSNISELSSMPNDEYLVRAIDQAGNESSIGFNIADPLFLVGGRKLIFSEPAIENAENQGKPGFYHRAGRSPAGGGLGHIWGAPEAVYG